MAIETVITCPLGSDCEKIDLKTGKLNRCAWYTCLAGQNPQTGELIDDWKCAMAWMPIMMVETSNTNRGTSAAVISLREETIKRQDEIIRMGVKSHITQVVQEDRFSNAKMIS